MTLGRNSFVFNGAMQANARIVAERLRAGGLNNAQIAAAMGHFTVESGMGTSPVPRHEAGYRGLAMWLGPRLDALYDRAGLTGRQRDIRNVSLTTQVDHFLAEIRGDESHFARRFMRATTIEEASRGMMNILRPSGHSMRAPQNGMHFSERTQNAHLVAAFLSRDPAGDAVPPRQGIQVASLTPPAHGEQSIEERRRRELPQRTAQTLPAERPPERPRAGEVAGGRSPPPGRGVPARTDIPEDIARMQPQILSGRARELPREDRMAYKRFMRSQVSQAEAREITGSVGINVNNPIFGPAMTRLARTLAQRQGIEPRMEPTEPPVNERPVQLARAEAPRPEASQLVEVPPPPPPSQAQRPPRPST